MNEPRSNGLQINGAGKCVDMGMGGGKSPYDAGGQDMSKQSGGMNEPTLKGITPNEHVQRTVGSLGGAMNEPRVGLTEEGGSGAGGYVARTPIKWLVRTKGFSGTSHTELETKINEFIEEYSITDDLYLNTINYTDGSRFYVVLIYKGKAVAWKN